MPELTAFCYTFGENCGLVLLLLGALPTWPYSGNWGYYPSGGLGLVLLIVVLLALTGRV
jgi:hypothetical protein